jgi:hypothetical protein
LRSGRKIATPPPAKTMRQSTSASPSISACDFLMKTKLKWMNGIK